MNYDWPLERDKDIVRSEEFKKNLSSRQQGANNTHAKGVRCTVSGKEFGTTTEAALYLGISQGQLSNMLSGRRKNNTSLVRIG